MIKEQHFAVLRPEDYRTQDTVFTFKAPEVGQYVTVSYTHLIKDEETTKKDAEADITDRFRRLYSILGLSRL